MICIAVLLLCFSGGLWMGGWLLFKEPDAYATMDLGRQIPAPANMTKNFVVELADKQLTASVSEQTKKQTAKDKDIQIRHELRSASTDKFQFLFIHSTRIIGSGKADEAERQRLEAAMRNYASGFPGAFIFDADGSSLKQTPVLLYANPDYDVTEEVRYLYENRQ